MIYGYIRVSTDKQDCENQKLGIEAKAKELGLSIEKYIQDNGVCTILVQNHCFPLILYFKHIVFMVNASQ